jgi:alkanesulfonate monooxygenase SsuD/methylene tetrahydromethanopterin reductase-like flavin-dependent oxidoreductase (luciferase family)
LGVKPGHEVVDLIHQLLREVHGPLLGSSFDEKVVYTRSGADADAIQGVREVTAERGAQAGAALVTDEIIDTFAVAGDTALAIRRFREYAQAGIRGLIIQHVPGPERVEGLTLIAEEVIPHVL